MLYDFFAEGKFLAREEMSEEEAEIWAKKYDLEYKPV